MKLRSFPSCLMLILAFAGSVDRADSQEIRYCHEETYADCTQAENCSPDASGIAVCTCKVAFGDSVTTGGCVSPSEDGLQSRYPGVPQMGACTSESKEWADCLGVSCSAGNETNDTQCQCKIATSADVDSKQFVIVGVESADAKALCTEGLQSSATPGQVFDATSVLRKGRTHAEAEIEVTTTIDPIISWIYSP